MPDVENAAVDIRTLAWHVVGGTLRDGRAVPENNVELRFDGDVEWCRTGLYATSNVMHTPYFSRFVNGPTFLCRVSTEELVRQDSLKYACRSRTILWRVPFDRFLMRRARRNILKVENAERYLTQEICNMLRDDDVTDAALAAACLGTKNLRYKNNGRRFNHAESVVNRAGRMFAAVEATLFANPGYAYEAVNHILVQNSALLFGDSFGGHTRDRLNRQFTKSLGLHLQSNGVGTEFNPFSLPPNDD